MKILVVDDSTTARRVVVKCLNELEHTDIVEAEDGVEALAKLKENPGIWLVLLDRYMPNMDGLEATRRIKALHPNIAVLVLTIHSDDQHIMGILEAGAAGYLTKSVYGEEVVQSIRGVVAGEMVLSPQIGQRLLKRAARYPVQPVPLPAGEKLTSRELEIIKLAARGLSNKNIAAELGLTVRTVKGHLANIFSKLHVGSRTEVVIAGLRAGFLSVDDIQ